MARPELSICIPTHDGRAAQLAEALGTVREQLLGDGLQGAVEVVVSDNGSRDGTREVVAREASLLGDSLRYLRFDENVGFRRNLLRVVGEAEGEFCWILGSDDALEPGALIAVLDRVRADPDLTGLTVNRVHVHEGDGRREFDPPEILPGPGAELLESADDVFSELGLLMDFISTQIVNRARWVAAVEEIGPAGIEAGYDFPHLPIMSAMVKRRPRWRWIPQPLLYHRSGEETLGAFGDTFFAHELILAEQRGKIWKRELGPRSRPLREVMRRAYRLQSGPWTMIFLKDLPGHRVGDSVALFRAMRESYAAIPDFWLRCVPVLLTPLPLIRFAARVARVGKRSLAWVQGRAVDAPSS